MREEDNEAMRNDRVNLGLIYHDAWKAAGALLGDGHAAGLRAVWDAAIKDAAGQDDVGSQAKGGHSPEREGPGPAPAAPTPVVDALGKQHVAACLKDLQYDNAKAYFALLEILAEWAKLSRQLERHARALAIDVSHYSSLSGHVPKSLSDWNAFCKEMLK